MAKQKLLVEYDFDFTLIGVSCHIEDYKFCWNVNKKLEMNFLREEDLEITGKSTKKNSAFSIYSWENEENYTSYFILSNKGSSGYLVPEHKNIDYFFLIKGPITAKDKASLITEVKLIDAVQTAFEIDPKQLKSKYNLLF